MRLAYALLTLTLCAAAALVGVFIASRGTAATAPSRSGPTGWAGSVRPPGAVAPDFALRDQDGEPVTMADYRGRPVAVTFVYSHCEDTCPALVDQVRGALDDSGADVPLLAVSVDPANDTPASARRFLNERRMTGRARFLLGSERELRAGLEGLRRRAAARRPRPLGLRRARRRRGPPARRLPVRPAHARGARARPPPAERRARRRVTASASWAASSRSCAAR